MEKHQLSVIRRDWENYLGTSMNAVYDNRDFQAVISHNLEGFTYNLVSPKTMDFDLSSLQKLEASFTPALYGEKEFIEQFRAEHFPDTELESEYCFMSFNGDKPEGKQFEGLDFAWVPEESTDDYLEVFQSVFGPSDFYMSLHREPAKIYGREVFRMVVYRDESPVSIGELRINGGDGFIYSLGTLKEMRGEGLGTEVLRRILLKAEQIGLNDVYLVTDGSSGLVDFYRDRGFDPEFRTVSYSGGSWDRLFD